MSEKKFLYPLKFDTIFKDKLWGGTKINDVLGRQRRSLLHFCMLHREFKLRLQLVHWNRSMYDISFVISEEGWQKRIPLFAIFEYVKGYSESGRNFKWSTAS